MLSVASILESLGHQIYFAWDNAAEITHLATMLGIDLKNPKLDQSIKELYMGHRPLAMYLATRPYDLVVYLSDGSIPLLGGRRNLLHMQVPFHGVGGKSWQNRLKKRFIHAIIVNSEFTKKVIDQEYGVSSTVLYPPVPSFASVGKKDPLILSVGRFEPSLNIKHQDVLIEAFKLISPRLPGWKLVFAGGSGNENWLSQLKAQAGNLPIEFAVNIPRAGLADLYTRAAIYWHAAGFGVDETKNPELTEHFGISTVEAGSAGCTPLVVPYGGQREIIPDSRFHWEKVEELIQKTLAFAHAPVLPQLEIARYSLDRFKSQLSAII